MEKIILKNYSDFKQERRNQHFSVSDIVNQLSKKGLEVDERTIRRFEAGKNVEQFEFKLKVIKEYLRILNASMEMFEQTPRSSAEEKLERIRKILDE